MVSSYRSSDMLNTVTVVPSRGDTTWGSSSAAASTGGASSSGSSWVGRSGFTGVTTGGFTSTTGWRMPAGWALCGS